MPARHHNQNANQAISSAVLNRISYLIEQRYSDEVLRRLLVDGGTNLELTQGRVAYFPDSCLVIHVGGDRSTGVQFQINAGLGFKQLGALQVVPDRASLVPVVVAAPFSFTVNPSDPTNPRIDRIFMRQRELAENPQSVFVIDPLTDAISTQSLNQDLTSTFETVYVAGTPAASPVVPAPPAGWTTDEVLAEIVIAPGSGSFSPGGGNLTDRRVLLELANGLVPSITSFPGTQVTVVAPLVDAHAQAALERLTTGLATAALSGSRNAPFEYLNTSSVRLAEGVGGNVRVEIDGVIVNTPAAFLFTLPTHLDTGSEAASTWYYCYVRNIGGVIVPLISVQAPLRADGTKIGYHPTITDARFIQAFRNDNSSNIVPFDELPDQTVQLRSTAAGSSATFFLDDIGAAASGAAYTSRALGARVPPGARSVRLVAAAMATRITFYYARSSLAASSPATFPSPHRLPIIDAGDAANQSGSLSFELSIADPSSPAYAWATVDAGGQQVSVHNVFVLGWRF